MLHDVEEPGWRQFGWHEEHQLQVESDLVDHATLDTPQEGHLLKETPHIINCIGVRVWMRSAGSDAE